MNDLNEQIEKMNKQAQAEQGSSTLENIAGIAGDGTSLAADVATGVALDVASDVTFSTLADLSLGVADEALGAAGELLGGLIDGI